MRDFFSIKSHNFYYQLRTLLFVDEIWLFGSRATETHQKRSDIDLSILCPRANEEDWQQVLTIVENSDILLKIDCVRFDILEDDRLKREIEQNKVVLFTRTFNTYNWYETFLDLRESLEKFQEILTFNSDEIPFLKEATIQIFEFSFELFWKLLKKIAFEEGLESNSPKTTLQQAFTMKLIDDQKGWLKMLEDRNLTSHTYNQPSANRIFDNCKTYGNAMQIVFQKIQERYKV